MKKTMQVKTALKAGKCADGYYQYGTGQNTMCYAISATTVPQSYKP
jgi:hypothetical protein